MDNNEILNLEYSKEFDKKRQNAIIVSYHKYGPAKENFQKGLVNAIGSLKKNLAKFEETGNTEYFGRCCKLRNVPFYVSYGGRRI